MAKDEDGKANVDEIDALDQVPAGDVLDKEEPVIEFDQIVTMGAEEFTIEEPSLEITMRILNSVGRMALRGERAAETILQNPTSRAAIWGLLAVIDVEDLAKLGAALLQFEDEKTGKKFIKGLRDSKDLRLAPLVKAFFLNWSQSTDMQEALGNFTAGVLELQAVLSVALPTFLTAQATPEEEEVNEEE